MKALYSLAVTGVVLALGYSFSNSTTPKEIDKGVYADDSISVKMAKINDSIKEVNTLKTEKVVNKVYKLDSINKVVEYKLDVTEAKLDNTKTKLEEVKKEFKELSNQPPKVVEIVKTDTIVIKVRDRIFGKDKIDTIRNNENREIF